MSPIALETEDHSRDAAFNKAMHGKSAQERAGFAAMLKKDPKAQKAAVDEYFKHWDDKTAGTETEEIREVDYCPPWLKDYLSDEKRFRLEDLNMPPSQDSTLPSRLAMALRFEPELQTVTTT